MDYSDLRAMLQPFVAKGWPAPSALAANTSYDIVGLTSTNPPVPVTVQQLEAALAAQLPGAPISAMLSAVPAELTQIANQFTSQIEISGLTLETGPSDGGGFAIRSFAISLDPAAHTAQLSGLTIEDYGLQLNFAPVGTVLVWNPILFATAQFLGVTCGLQVGLLDPSITLALSEGAHGTIDTILGSTSSGTSLSSLTSAMGVDLGQSAVTLDLLLVHAELGTPAEFDCALGLGFGSDVAWGPFGLSSLAICFTHGSGDTSFDAKVVASIGGYEVDGDLAYDSAAGTNSFSGNCPAIGASLADFWNALAGQLGVPCPVPGLDDVYISGISLAITQAGGATSFEIHCGGSLVFDALGAPMWFDFSFDKEATGDIITKLKLSDIEFDLTTHAGALVFSFTGPEQLPLADLVAAAQINALTSLANSVDLTLEAADLILVKTPPATTNQILFAAKLGFNATVSSDILTMITGASEIGCTGATLFGANAAWTLDQIGAVPGRAVAISQPVPQGVSAIPVLAIGSVTAAIPLAPPTTANASGSSPAPSPPDPYGGVPSTAGTWFKIQKQIGPVYVDQLGIGMDSGSDGIEILLMATAAFTLGPLTITLSGFEIDIPYSNPSAVAVSLHGLNLAYDNPPLTIEGGFLMAGDGLYLGDLTIKSETFILGAIGEYAKKSDYTSLAIFAAMTDPPLGGPVFCFVEGLAAGFGYNSALNVPTKASDVANFALVQVASGGLPASDPFSIIESCIAPNEGSDWIAVGLVFRSFEIVESTALLTASFGNDLQFAILGQSEMSLPPASPERIAYAQVDVLAQYIPSQQALSVSGILTSKSYVLSPDCHIQGGFLYMINGSGEFVISYGGYAPGFDYQSLGYPDVPRLMLSWTIDSHTSIVGQEYCALTPAAMMAGGSLHASWDSGIFSAWFDVAVDVLIQWRPFHYYADFSMSLGVSFDLKILFVHVHFTFHIGASLTVHGPPFGGHAHIDLDVISFDIDFGADDSGPGALDWDGFRAMLPGDPSTDATASPLLGATVTDGLVKDCSGTATPAVARARALAATADEDTPDWVVNGTHFSFAIKSSLPITKASSGKVTVTEPPVGATIGILPMAVGNAEGTLDVTITGPEGVIVASTDPAAEISVAPMVTQGAPALWGQSSPADNNAPPIPMTTGYFIKGGIKPSTETMIVDVADLLDENILVRAISDRPAAANPFTQEALT